MTKLCDRLLSSSLLFNSTKASLDSVMLSREIMTQPWRLSGDHVLSCHCWTVYTKHLQIYIYQVSRQSWSPRGIGGKHDRSRTSNSKSSRKGLPLCAASQRRLWSSKTSERWASCMFVLNFWVVLGKGETWLTWSYERSVRYWRSIRFRALEAACLGDFTVPVSFFMMLLEETFAPPHFEKSAYAKHSKDAWLYTDY